MNDICTCVIQPCLAPDDFFIPPPPVPPPPPIISVRVCNEAQTAECPEGETGDPVTIPAETYCVTLKFDASTPQSAIDAAVSQMQTSLNVTAMDAAEQALVCEPAITCGFDIEEFVFNPPTVVGNVTHIETVTPTSADVSFNAVSTAILQAEYVANGSLSPTLGDGPCSFSIVFDLIDSQQTFQGTTFAINLKDSNGYFIFEFVLHTSIIPPTPGTITFGPITVPSQNITFQTSAICDTANGVSFEADVSLQQNALNYVYEIQGYVDNLFANSSPVGGQPAWDGKFNFFFQRVGFGTVFQASSAQNEVSIDGGKPICNACLLYDNGAAAWRLKIKGGTGSGTLWEGECQDRGGEPFLVTGTTPTGLFTRVGGDDLAPATLTIQTTPGAITEGTNANCLP